METKNDNESIIKEIAKYFLSNNMVKEKDLLRRVPSRVKLINIIKVLNYRFSLVGCEIIKTDFLDEDYYVLVIEGKEQELTGKNYGILSIISFLNWEYNYFLSLNDALEIFSDFKNDINSLILSGYLVEYNINDVKHLLPTPIAKVLFKNMVNKIKIEDIFRSIGIDTSSKLSEIKQKPSKIKEDKKKKFIKTEESKTKNPILD